MKYGVLGLVAWLALSSAQAEPFAYSLRGPVLDVQSLDVDGNGAVDEEDSRALDELAIAAEAHMGGRPAAQQEPFYGGVGNISLEGLFAQPGYENGAWDFANVTVEHARQIAVESRWLASQVRIAMGVGANAQKERRLAGILNAEFPGFSAETMKPSAVCQAIRLLDTKKLRASGVVLSAVFDLDKTVWAGHAIDHFLAALVESGLVRSDAQNALVTALSSIDSLDRAVLEENSVQVNAALALKYTTDKTLPKNQLLSRKDGFYLVAAMLQGLKPSQAYAVADRAMKLGTGSFAPLQNYLYDDGNGCSMRRLIGQLRSSGFQVYFISAGLDVLVEVAGDLLGVGTSRRLGSVLRRDAGTYTGEVASTYVFKGTILRDWLRAPPFLAFGDSASSDLPFMLDAAGPAFMVNPGERFLKKDAELAGGRLVELRFANTEVRLPPSTGFHPIEKK